MRKIHHEKFSCGELVSEDCEMAKRFTGHKVRKSHSFKDVNRKEDFIYFEAIGKT